jgi:putative phosphonate metabolism protein
MAKPAAYRYAVYFAPSPQSHAWALASQWLGRCAATGQLYDQPTVAGLSAAEFAALTAAPRRYGWHATLKAPFVLAQGSTEDSLRGTVAHLAMTLKAFDLPTLRVTQLDDFLALTADGDTAELHAAANACVTELHHCAAPLGESELQRRRNAHLTARQDELLVRWGYPYVLEEFRFHCSLTGSLGQLTAQKIHAVEQAAQTNFDKHTFCKFDTLAVFVEPTPGADFMLLEHFKLGVLPSI